MAFDYEKEDWSKVNTATRLYYDYQKEQDAAKKAGLKQKILDEYRVRYTDVCQNEFATLSCLQVIADNDFYFDSYDGSKVTTKQMSEEDEQKHYNTLMSDIEDDDKILENKSFSDYAKILARLKAAFLLAKDKNKEKLNKLMEQVREKIANSSVNKQDKAAFMEADASGALEGVDQSVLTKIGSKLFNVATTLKSNLKEREKEVWKILANISLFNDQGKADKETFGDFSGIIDDLDVVDENDNPVENKKVQLEGLFDAAKAETAAEVIGNEKISLEKVRNYLQTIFSGYVITAAGASHVPEPNNISDEQSYNRYLENVKAKLQEFINTFGSKKIKIKTKQLETATANALTEADEKVKTLEKDNNVKLTTTRTNIQRIREHAGKIKGWTFEVTENVVKNIKANKWQHLANTAATIGVGAASLWAAPYLGVAVAGYAVYSAAGAWTWPVLGLAKKLQSEAKQNNQKISFRDAWEKAWNIKKEDKNYKNTAIFGTVAGVVGAGLGLGSMAAAGISGVAAKTGAFLARSASSTTAQLTSFIHARKDYIKNSTPENLANQKAARNSLILGATLSGIFSYLSLDNMEVNGGAELTGQANSINADSLQHNAISADSLSHNAISADSLQHNAISADSLQHNAISADSLSDNAISADSLQHNAISADSLASKQTVGTETITDGGAVPAAATATDNILVEKLGGNVERTTTVENGVAYVQYNGIPEGDVQTSESFQNFLDKRIHTKGMNQYNNLVTVRDAEGAVVPLEDATAVMLDRLENEFTLPQGMSEEHALYVAYMRAHYYGDKSLLNLIACPEGADTNITAYLSEHAKEFNTHSIKGVPMGYPVDENYKAINKAFNVDTILCQKEVAQEIEEVKPVTRSYIETEVKVETPPTAINFAAAQDAPRYGTEVFAGDRHDYAVTGDVSGRFIRVDNDGNVRVWEQDGMHVKGSDYISRRSGGEMKVPFAVNLSGIENLPKPDVAENGGVTTLAYGKGDNALTILVEKDGDAHAFVGKQEIYLDTDSANKMGEIVSNNMKDYVPSAETENANAHLRHVSGNRTKMQKAIDKAGKKISDMIAKACQRGR